MKNETTHTPLEIEAKLHLKRSFLRAALTVAGGSHSTPEALQIAGAEAAILKREIAVLESQLPAEKRQAA